MPAEEEIPMKKNTNFLQKMGIGLVLLSFILLLGSEIFAISNRTATRKLTEQLRNSLPERTQGDPQGYSDPRMPALQLQGTDFLGLIEMPAYGVALPLGSSWNQGALNRHPCRFQGSVYDSSLIVGGSGTKGQFDIFGRMELGDKIRITDMTGAQFSYKVTDIDRRSHADMEIFREKERDLILFARDQETSNYILVRCLLAPESPD
jgi:sortase A